MWLTCNWPWRPSLFQYFRSRDFTTRSPLAPCHSHLDRHVLNVQGNLDRFSAAEKLHLGQTSFSNWLCDTSWVSIGRPASKRIYDSVCCKWELTYLLSILIELIGNPYCCLCNRVHNTDIGVMNGSLHKFVTLVSFLEEIIPGSKQNSCFQIDQLLELQWLRLRLRQA